MTSWDATVVGAGIAGLSTAAILSSRGYKVRVLDPSYPYQTAASSMSAGIVVSGMPGILGTLAGETARVFKVNRLIISRESIYIYPDKDCALRSKSVVEASGFEWNQIEYDEALDFAGTSITLGDEEVTAVVEEYLVDAGSFLTRLHSMILESGGVVERSMLNRIEGGLTIVAAGPWTPEILPEIKDRIIIYRCQAQTLTESISRITIEDESLGYYLARHPGESIVGDGSNAILDDADSGFKPDMEDAYMVLERVAKRLPEAAYTGLKRVWSAPCIVGLDGFPLVGPVRDDVYVITGFNGAGITLAWGAAVLLADIIEGVRRTPAEVDPLRVSEGSMHGDRPREPYDIC